MDIAFIILLVPFFIPLFLLTMLSLYLNKQKRIITFAEYIFPYSPLFWILPIITIPLLRDWYDTKSAGTLLTLLIPNIIFLFAYLPEFVLLKYTLLRNLYNGLFTIISTLVFWQLTVTPSNWGESALAFIFIIPALIGMTIFTSVILRYRSKEQALVFKKQVFIGVILLVVIIALKERTHNYENLESSRKIQLIQAVVRYFTEKGSEKFSQTGIIESGYLNGIYEIKNEIITNKYGGTISVALNGDYISVIYTHIPAKEPCFEMYNMNHPSIYGFEEIYVSGIKVPSILNSSQKIEETKQQLCFSSSEPKIIEFRGRIQKIKEITERQKIAATKPKLQITPNPQVAEKVFLHFSKLSVPGNNSNDFEHWTYMIALFATIDCWENLNPSTPAPKSLLKVKPTKGGVWSFPSKAEISKLCHSLAEHGIKPVCTSSLISAKGVQRKQDLPLDYIQIYKLDPLQIEGKINCYLTPNQIGKQGFYGKINATWIEKPRVQNFNLLNGPKELLAGTLMITSPNAPGLTGEMYKKPKTAVVISK